MENLVKLKQILYDNKFLGTKMKYRIPNVWNAFGYEGNEVDGLTTFVNPYLFYHSSISHIMENAEERNTKIEYSYVYSSMIRTSMSYDHDNSGSLDLKNVNGMKETGTFIKMIAYLPTLKKIGINTIYLLPIMKASKYEKKGELGSVYGVVDFFQLETDLLDPITKDLMTLDEQFKAFVEAAHLYGMNVVLDIIPRTNSVNSQFVIDHPEWFYWIDTKDESSYSSPKVASIGSTVGISEDNIEEVYASEDVRKHISLFRQSPNILYPEKWNKFIVEYKKCPDIEMLPLIKEHFQMRTAPAFSDVINDMQPPWTDVTYFRLYLDEPQILKEKGINIDQTAPYMLFDTIKCNLFPGKIKNESLWNTLIDILPYYIKEFDIDGARIDMGHALPIELSKQIISQARKEKKNFYFIAEILATDEESVQKAKDLGYDLVIGDGFYHTHRFREEKTRAFYYSATKAPLRIFAGGETHDSPRLLAREGGFSTLQFVTIMNLFVNNCVPFLNSGQELLEIQPMNTGIDCQGASDEMLDHSDPYYKKLALFDYYQFHYENFCPAFFEILEKASTIRQQFIDLIVNNEAVTCLEYPENEKMAFVYEFKGQKLVVLGNASLTNTVSFLEFVNKYKVIFSTGDNSLVLKPLDICIILEEK